MIETAYLTGVPVALIIITMVKARKYGFVTVGGFMENIFLAICWPFSISTCEYRCDNPCEFHLWGR